MLKTVANKMVLEGAFNPCSSGGHDKSYELSEKTRTDT